ncbi:hypothetical protein KC361_g9336 [Hortaea werneckii]|nr:hypothetical protein KC361_g9336 [Hortaea werneckii]
MTPAVENFTHLAEWQVVHRQRRKQAQAVADEVRTWPDVEHSPSAFEAPPIIRHPILEVLSYEEAWRCTIDVQCTFVSPKLESIKWHWRAQHDAHSNHPNGGGSGQTKAQIAQARLEQGTRRMQGQPLFAQGPHSRWIEVQSQGRLLGSSRKRIHAGEAEELNPWLKWTRWIEYLQGCDRSDFVKSVTLAAEEEEEEEKESSTASDSGCESDDSTSLESDAPMIALGRACLGFCIELLHQRIHNRDAFGELESKHIACGQHVRHLQSENNDLSVSLGRRSDATEQLQGDLRESNFKNEQWRNLYQPAATDTKRAGQPSLPAATRTQENHNLEKRFQEFQKACQVAEAQAKTFKHELFLFKKSAAASAKVTNQLGDDDIRKKFDNVFYALQDFALSTPHGSSIAADTPNTKAWLGLTRKMLLEIDLKADMDADEMLAEMAVKHTVEMLSAAIAINWAAEKPTMHKIFPSVIGLYRNLHCCKAIFKLRMISCHSSQRPSIFAMTTIEAVTSDENEDSLTSRPIELSVFPGICKYGNEMCRNQHHMTVICRTRAILQKIKRKQAQLGEDVPTKNTRIKQEPV